MGGVSLSSQNYAKRFFRMLLRAFKADYPTFHPSRGISKKKGDKEK
jgi:hypothetical protein